MFCRALRTSRERLTCADLLICAASSRPLPPQVSVIDGRRWQSAGELDGALDACQLLCNRQGQPLLAHGPTGSYTEDWRVIVPLTRGRAVLPGLTFTDSSEALLSGRAPPFRLLVRAVGWDGKPLPGIRHCLSDPFVVSKGAGGGAGRASNPRQGLLHISSCLRAPLQNTYSPPTPRTTHTHTHMPTPALLPGGNLARQGRQAGGAAPGRPREQD